MPNKWLISYLTGSAGTLISCLLDRILHNSEKEILLTAENSAHGNDYITNYIHCPPFKWIGDDYNFFLKELQSTSTTSSISKTHIFPEFETLEKFCPNIKIILIKVNKENLKEIAWNTIYKLHRPSKFFDCVDNHVQDTIKMNNKFFNEDIKIPANCVIINYHEIFLFEQDNFYILTKLSEITGKTDIPNNCITTLKNYCKTRDSLIQIHNL